MRYLIKQEGFDFAFDPSACSGCGGKCCTGSSGVIWIDDKEIFELSKHLNLEVSEFQKEFTRVENGKRTLREFRYKDGYACCFFDTTKQQCEIYEFRPKQCREFPFWDYFKDKISEVKEECPGIVC
jgi:Fe-S-cluster containining protein